MARSKETFNKKEVRQKKEKKRKEKAQRKVAKKEEGKSSGSDMIAYVDEYGRFTSTPPEHVKEVVIAADIEVSIPKRSADEDFDPTRKGIVSFFNDSKGYGFIRDSDTKESVFVHANNLLDEIKEGNVVTFEKEKGLRGPAAVKVKLFKSE